MKRKREEEKRKRKEKKRKKKKNSKGMDSSKKLCMIFNGNYDFVWKSYGY